MLLIFANDPAVRMGGVEVFNQDLEKLLASKSIRFMRFGSSKSAFFWNFSSRLIKSLWFLARNRTGLVVVQHSSVYDVLAVLLFSIIQGNVTMISHVGDSWGHIKNKYTLRFLHFTCSRQNVRLLCISSTQKKFLPPKAKLVPTIVSSEFLAPPESVSLVSDEYILFIGRVTERKGIWDLIEAFNASATAYDLLIIGPIDEAVAQRLPIKNPRVNFLGPIYDVPMKIRYIDNCKFMIYPSYEDAFPLSVIECFLRKKVMLTTNISETSNYIIDERLLFNPGDRAFIADFINNFEPSDFDLTTETMYMRSLPFVNGSILNHMDGIYE